MVEYSDKHLDGVFAALSDSTRRSIVGQLRDGPATVGELAKPHHMSFQGVSKHLKKLEAAGLVRRRKEGREVWCELVVEPMRQASTWIEEQRRFWEFRLDRLGEVLDDGGTTNERTSEDDTEPDQLRDESDGNEND